MGRRKTAWDDSPAKDIYEELKLLAGDSNSVPVNRYAFWQSCIEPKYHLSYSAFVYHWTQLQIGTEPRLIMDEYRGVLRIRDVQMIVKDDLPDN